MIAAQQSGNHLFAKGLANAAAGARAADMIRNLTRETELAACAWVAHTHRWRMRGMIARRFDPFDALIFERTNSIHMLFMRMPLDVVFLDRDNRVTSVREHLRPWRLAADFKARTVIELPAGTIARTATAPGDELDLAPAATV